ncbi:MAG: class I SAM-dependent methyltransferase [Elusimicrobia bacterium]|nr:class I SAM-dependent methyltransferase [Elusimicrobiota bacterium]
MTLAEVFADREVAELYRFRAPYPNEVVSVLQGLVRTPAVVLDAGAGTGAIARQLAPVVERVDAVDPSAAMIAMGRRLPGGTDPRIRWLRARIEDAALDGPYGLITCGASLHWMDRAVALARFRDVLAPGAVLAIVDTHNVHGAYKDDVVDVIRAYSEVEHHRETRDLIDDLQTSGDFRLYGVLRTDPVTFEQTVSEYVEMLHSTSTLARVRLRPRSDAFDAAIRSVFARHGMDRVRYGVIGLVAWGRP